MGQKEMISRDRMARAEDYVLGLMDEHERMRAERDMEVDPEFRQCVLNLAHKLQRLHEMTQPPRAGDQTWNEIAARIAGMPHMAGETIPTPRMANPMALRPVGQALHALGGRRGLAVALAMIVVFALGYLAAAFS